MEKVVCVVLKYYPQKGFPHWVLMPPPPTHLIKLILLHTVVVLQYTAHIQMTCLIKGENAVKLVKNKISLVTNFVQTCSLISIYTDMSTVCSYDTLQ